MVALALALFLWRTALPAAREQTYAFSAYYTAARLTILGQAGPRFCDEWFFERQRELGFGRHADYFCPNPPTNALAMVPVAWLPPGPARYAWIALDLAFVVAILAIGWRLVLLLDDPRPRRWTMDDGRWARSSPHLSSIVYRLSSIGGRRSPLGYAALAAVVVALYRPLHADLHAGQVYTLLALCYALWLYGYASGRDRVCGAGLAGLVLLKLAGWPLWVLMLAARRWRALGWALAIGVVAGLLTLPLLGLDFWLLYMFGQVPAISADPESAVPAFQTLISLLRQLFVYDARWSPIPLTDAPWLASLIWWAAALALVGTTLAWLVQSQPGKQTRALVGMAMLCLAVPLQPAGEDHHYALLLIVIVVLLTTGRAWRRTALPLAGVLLAGLLLALPPYFLATDAWTGWPWALLAYPRLYGALLLWAAHGRALIEMRDSSIAQVQIISSQRTV